MKRVLVIDPNPVYLKYWERLLAGKCELVLTNDPKEGEGIIKDLPVDLVISEVVMSESTGYETANITHKLHPEANIVLTTSYDCDLRRFDLSNPKFHILYKPYHDAKEIERFINHLLLKEDPTLGADEDSFSENDVYPTVMEWKL